jgi:hypothetical protein
VNKTTETIIAIVALLGLVAFMSVLVAYVAEPDLIVIVVIGLLFAAHDFWRELFRGKGNGN